MEGQLDVSRKELATSGERVEATKPKDNLKLEGKLQGDISLVYDLEPKVLSKFPTALYCCVPPHISSRFSSIFGLIFSDIDLNTKNS